MNRQDMLAKLITQARGGLVTLRAIVEDSTVLGAERILKGQGASEDIGYSGLREPRKLLRALRSAKASVWKATIEWLVRGLLAFLPVRIAVRLDLSGRLT